MSSIKPQNDKEKLNKEEKSLFQLLPDNERAEVDGGCLKRKTDFSPKRANATGIEKVIDNTG